MLGHVNNIIWLNVDEAPSIAIPQCLAPMHYHVETCNVANGDCVNLNKKTLYHG